MYPIMFIKQELHPQGVAFSWSVLPRSGKNKNP